MQNTPIWELELGVQDGPIPADLLLRRGRRGQVHDGARDEVVQVHGVTPDGKAAEDHQVVHVAHGVRPDGRRAVVPGVGRLLEEAIQRRERARPALAHALRVDLLQAQHVGPERHERRAQHADALRERRRLAGAIVEALQVVGREPEAHPPSIVRPLRDPVAPRHESG